MAGPPANDSLVTDDKLRSNCDYPTVRRLRMAGMGVYRALVPSPADTTQ
jgi:hypothetical protein